MTLGEAGAARVKWLIHLRWVIYVQRMHVPLVFFSHCSRSHAGVARSPVLVYKTINTLLSKLNSYWIPPADHLTRASEMAARRHAGSSSGSTSANLSMKLLVEVDRRGTPRRVVYAEAGKDVVDFLLTFLTLPIGTVVKLLRRNSMPMVGCVGNLYGSVEKLPDDFICHRDARAAKDTLLRPAGGRLPLLTNAGSSSTGGFVRAGVTYTVMDDLEVAPRSNVDFITSLNKYGIRDISCLHGKDVQVGHTEVIHEETILFFLS
ncbi:hypothetical protein VPH35_058751 [Triticum aestivum]